MLIALIGLAVVLIAAFGVLGFAVLLRTDSKQKKAELDAAAILDATFNGAEDVTVKVNMTTLKYETYVTGAKQRGYRLVHQADNQYGPHTLMFEKA